MSIFCLFFIFVIYFSIFFFTVLSHFCKLIFSFFHFLFFITQYGFFPFIMVIWLQRGVICMKTFFKNLTFTFLCLGISTILAFFFFNLGQKNSVNTALIYILALILIAQNTTSYWYGAAASVFCVIAANYFFTYPYFKLNFILDGYPVTFIGMLAISLITSATASMLKKQKAIASERERKLAEAEREKIHANLLRAVSHDLRTPLTSIIGSSASYLDDAQNMSEQERMELISNINEDAQWLLNMVENLLSVTKIQNESSKVKKSQEIVEEVVSESIVRLQKRLPKIQIRVSMPEDFLMIPMDATLIEQVLINLMENAYVHSSSSDPIDLLITDQPDCVTFAVRDYGIGLDPDQIPFIFDGQYSSDTADGHKGIGIGLSICRTIIHAHDGVIHAANLDKGAEFSFTLPKEKENANYA